MLEPPERAGRKRLGVIGSFVWDVIHGRDVRAEPVEGRASITWSSRVGAIGMATAANDTRQAETSTANVANHRRHSVRAQINESVSCAFSKAKTKPQSPGK